MAKDEINIAIAEVCQWREIQAFLGGLFGLPPDTWKGRRNYLPGLGKCEVPNFASDLNAMHEAENVLTVNQRNAYVNHLDSMVGEVEDQVERDFLWCCASASRRAEAFLRTIGKWKD